MSEHIYEDSDMEHECYHVIPFGWQREEIVRCRNCKHYHEYQDLCERLKPWMVVDPDGFCAWGEREDDDAR